MLPAADESSASEAGAALDEDAEEEWLNALASEVREAGAKARKKRTLAAEKKAGSAPSGSELGSGQMITLQRGHITRGPRSLPSELLG